MRVRLVLLPVLAVATLTACSGSEPSNVAQPKPTTSTGSSGPSLPQPSGSFSPVPQPSSPPPIPEPAPAKTASDPLVQGLLEMMEVQAKLRTAGAFGTDVEAVQKAGWKAPDPAKYTFKVERVDNEKAKACLSGTERATSRTVVYDSSKGVAPAAEGDCRSGF